MLGTGRAGNTESCHWTFFSSSSKGGLLTYPQIQKPHTCVSSNLKSNLKSPWVSPATWGHLDLGQVRISPHIPSSMSSQVCSLMQQPGVATYLAAVLQFCTISCAWRCFSSSNTAPHITHSGMQLTCAPISVRICIVLLMHLHLLLSLYSPPWRIYFLSMRGGFLGISLCNAPGGKETPCLIDSPAAEVGILSSQWMLQVLCDLQDRFC